jgi:hypothetical protein
MFRRMAFTRRDGHRGGEKGSRAEQQVLLSHALSSSSEGPDQLSRVRPIQGRVSRRSDELQTRCVRAAAHSARTPVVAHAEQFIERLDLASHDETAAALLASSWISHDGTLADTPAVLWAGTRLTWALWLRAGECCAFLERADLRSERWVPYLRWARSLAPSDAVLTFNYDRVPDLLETELGRRSTPRLQVMTPTDLVEDVCKVARALKLHGSVDWVQDMERFTGCCLGRSTMHMPAELRCTLTTSTPALRRLPHKLHSRSALPRCLSTPTSVRPHAACRRH